MINFRIETDRIIQDFRLLAGRDAGGTEEAIRAYFEDLAELETFCRQGSINQLHPGMAEEETSAPAHPLAEHIVPPKESAAPTPRPSCDVVQPLILLRPRLYYAVVLTYDKTLDLLSAQRFVAPDEMDKVAWTFAR